MLGLSPPEPPAMMLESSDDMTLVPLTEPTTKDVVVIREDLNDDEDFGYPSDMEENLPSAPVLELSDYFALEDVSIPWQELPCEGRLILGDFDVEKLKDIALMLSPLPEAQCNLELVSC